MHADRVLHAAALLAAMNLGACALTAEKTNGEPPAPAVVVEPVSPVAAGDVNLRALLALYRKSRGMSATELARERAALQGKTAEPLQAMRLAVLLGHERSELARALGLLDGIAKSDDPQALALQPFARLLSDQYAERLKLEVQVDRLGANIRESERRAAALQEKAATLQEKIDALADIERNLPGRPTPPVPTPERPR